MSHCRFCSVAVDPDWVERSAVLLDRINEACATANWIKASNFAIPQLFLISLVALLKDDPVTGIYSIVSPRRSNAWLLLQVWFIIGPAAILAWRKKYKDIQTDDADFNQAKIDTRRSLWFWLVMIWLRVLLQLVITPIDL